jgi:hypothetical protein
MSLPKLNENLEQARNRDHVEQWDRLLKPRYPKSFGDESGYSPSLQAEIENRSHKVAVESTRTKERVEQILKYGATIIAAAGVMVGASKLGEKYIAHEQNPWVKNTPAHTRP